MRAALKETNWDQVLGDVENLENAKENFTRVLIDTAKKSNIALYKQKRTIELEGRITKVNSKRMALKAQIQKQFIQIITNKELKEEKSRPKHGNTNSMSKISVSVK